MSQICPYSLKLLSLHIIYNAISRSIIVYFVTAKGDSESSTSAEKYKTTSQEESEQNVYFWS